MQKTHFNVRHPVLKITAYGYCTKIRVVNFWITQLANISGYFLGFLVLQFQWAGRSKILYKKLVSVVDNICPSCPLEFKTLMGALTFVGCFYLFIPFQVFKHQSSKKRSSPIQSFINLAVEWWKSAQSIVKPPSSLPHLCFNDSRGAGQILKQQRRKTVLLLKCGAFVQNRD